MTKGEMDNVIEMMARAFIAVIIVYQYAQLDFSCMSYINLIGVLLLAWVVLPFFDIISKIFEREESKK